MEKECLLDNGVTNTIHSRYKANNVVNDVNVLRWCHLNVHVTESIKEAGSRFKFIKQFKQVLKNCSGHAKSGEILAILGASGAGKSTLLNNLTFRNTKNMKTSGSVFFNNERMSGDAMKQISAYVQQDDLFIGTLTVRETLFFHARMRLDRNVSKETRTSRVNEVMRQLKLTKCADTLIGIPGKLKGISGGEKKRLAFGCEVLTDPLIMFCDEPTSGLDSFMALKVLGVLKAMANLGKIVIFTIHQPSSHMTDMFDKVLYVADGRIAFQGTVPESIDFLSRLGFNSPPNFNPAEFFIQQIADSHLDDDANKKKIKRICEYYESSRVIDEESGKNDEKYVRYHHYRKERNKIKCYEEFIALILRSWASTRRNPTLAKVRLAQTLLVGVLIGFIYQSLISWRDMNGAMFLFLTNLTFQNVFAVVGVFCSELPLFFREVQNGLYRPTTYFLSTAFTQMPFFAVYAFFFTIPSYLLVGLRMTASHFFTAAGINMLVSLSAISFGYFISCATPNVNVAMTVSPPLILPLLLYGGFFMNVDSIPFFLTWMKTFSWFSYGFEALVINQWSDNTTVPCQNNITCPRSGEDIIRILGFSDSSVNHGAFGLLALVLVYCFSALITLIFKSKLRIANIR